MATEWKGGPDGRRYMGLGVVEGTLVNLRKREIGLLDRKRKRDRFKQKAETQIEIYELDLLVRIYFIYLYACILNLFSHLNKYIIKYTI